MKVIYSDKSCDTCYFSDSVPRMFIHHSHPRQAPRINNYTQASKIKPHKTRVKRKIKSAKFNNNSQQQNESVLVAANGRAKVNGVVVKNNVLTKSQGDFIGSSDEDEEPIQMTALKRRSPRNKQSKKYSQPAYYKASTVTTNKQYSPGRQHNRNQKHNTAEKASSSGSRKTSRDEIVLKTNNTSSFKKSPKNKYSHSNYELLHLQIPVSAHSPHLPEDPDYDDSIYPSVNPSESRKSFNKRDLREIPKNELQLRKSGVSRVF